MTIITSQTIDSNCIIVEKYLGIVSAAVVMALPGGNKAVQRGWQAAVEAAVAILEENATALGADAVIAVRFESGSGTLRATGTAVKLG